MLNATPLISLICTVPSWTARRKCGARPNASRPRHSGDRGIGGSPGGGGPLAERLRAEQPRHQLQELLVAVLLLPAEHDPRVHRPLERRDDQIGRDLGVALLVDRPAALAVA